MSFADRAAKDFRQIAKRDLPVSFRLRKKEYKDGSFNPGSLTYDPVSGGVIDDEGTATLMYAMGDLPAKKYKPFEEISVKWFERWIEFEILNFFPGHAVGTFTLRTSTKR